MTSRGSFGFILPLYLFLACLPLTAQMFHWSSESPRAAEEFRLGVQSFQRGYLNESILSFEKALSISPEDPLILSWLARSYYRSGFDVTSIELWKRVQGSGTLSPFVASRIEFLSASKATSAIQAVPEALIEAGVITNKLGREISFKRPSWASPNPDGSFWLTAFGSDELIRYDVNGLVVERLKGPIGGLDRPFCALSRPSGGFYVSEFGIDSISILDSTGNLLKRFGGKGRGPGQLLGPQYLCLDEDGYLWVSDYGNRRISKFDAEGEFVLSFGAKQDSFPGFSSPTGIAYLGDTLYVADAFRKSVYAFDKDGNFLRTVVASGLSKPEGLSRYSENLLLVADGDKLLSLNVLTEEAVLLYSGQERKNRINCAVTDANGSVLALDFDSSRLAILSPQSQLYSGFFVNVLRVNAERFPLIDLEVSVQDAKRRPVSGLNVRNFYITEQIASIFQREEAGRSVPYQVYSAQAISSFDMLQDPSQTTGLDSIILMDSSSSARNQASRSKEALKDMLDAASAYGSLGYVLAGKNPSFDGSVDPELLANKLSAPRQGQDSRLDAGIRLAASKLLATSSRKAIFFLTDGDIKDQSFQGYSIAELAAYLANNGIVFYTILMGNQAAHQALEYFCSETGGEVIYLHRPQGMKERLDRIARGPLGRYTLRFSSKNDSDFGRTYLPIAVEAYLMKRSGRDEFGCFAPLK